VAGRRPWSQQSWEALFQEALLSNQEDHGLFGAAIRKAECSEGWRDSTKMLKAAFLNKSHFNLVFPSVVF
jgi:hypothetical protein